MISPRRILLVRPDRLGDLILSLPVAEVLKKEIDGVFISYLVSNGVFGISAMVGYVDEWLVDSNKYGRRFSVVELKNRIREGRFDCVVELKPSWRTSAAGYLAGVPVRIGTSRRVYSLFYNKRVNVHRRSSGFHQTDLDLAHLRALGITAGGIDPRVEVTPRGLSKAAELVKVEKNSYLVIHPGSGGSAPNWPRERFIALASEIVNKTGFKVVVTNHDRNIGGFDRCTNLGGMTDLETLAGVIKGARLFISGSTGPLHLADALGAACVSFFSNRSDIGPERWGPRRNLNLVLTTKDPCRCPGASSCRCLEGISVGDAFNKVTDAFRLTENLPTESK